MNHKFNITVLSTGQAVRKEKNMKHQILTNYTKRNVRQPVLRINIFTPGTSGMKDLIIETLSFVYLCLEDTEQALSKELTMITRQLSKQVVIQR